MSAWRVLVPKRRTQYITDRFWRSSCSMVRRIKKKYYHHDAGTRRGRNTEKNVRSNPPPQTRSRSITVGNTTRHTSAMLDGGELSFKKCFSICACRVRRRQGGGNNSVQTGTTGKHPVSAAPSCPSRMRGRRGSQSTAAAPCDSGLPSSQATGESAHKRGQRKGKACNVRIVGLKTMPNAHRQRPQSVAYAQDIHRGKRLAEKDIAVLLALNQLSQLRRIDVRPGAIVARRPNRSRVGNQHVTQLHCAANKEGKGGRVTVGGNCEKQPSQITTATLPRRGKRSYTLRGR